MDKYGILNLSKDMCVLCFLKYTQNKTCREKRIYTSLLKRYEPYKYVYQLEQASLCKGYIEKELPSNPLEVEHDIPSIATRIGRNAIEYGVIKSETGICFGNIWFCAISIIAKKLHKIMQILFISTYAIISDFIQKCKHLRVFTGLNEVGNPNLEVEPFQIDKCLNLPQCPYIKRLTNLISFLSHQ